MMKQAMSQQVPKYGAAKHDGWQTMKTATSEETEVQQPPLMIPVVCPDYSLLRLPSQKSGSSWRTYLMTGVGLAGVFALVGYFSPASPMNLSRSTNLDSTSTDLTLEFTDQYSRVNGE